MSRLDEFTEKKHLSDEEKEAMLDRAAITGIDLKEQAAMREQIAAQADAQAAALRAQEDVQRLQVAINIVGLDKTKSGVSEKLRGECNEFLSGFLARGFARE